MKTKALGAILLAPLALTLPTLAQTSPTPARPNMVCSECEQPVQPAPGDPGDPGGGGGGGGYTPPVYPQTERGNPIVSSGVNLGLTYRGQDSSKQLGGTLAREAPAASAYQGDMFLAYPDRVWQEQNNETLRDSQVRFDYRGQNAVITADTGTVYTSATPALLTVSQQKNGNVAISDTLYLAVNNRLGGGYQTRVYYRNQNNTGNVWTEINTSYSIPQADYSPSLSFDDSYVYLALRAHSGSSGEDHTHVVTICRQPLNNLGAAFSCNVFNGKRDINFNPGITASQISGPWVLYLPVEEYNNTHELRLFTSADQGQSIYETSDIAAGGNDDQSSVGPTALAYNSAVYVGFRSNDSDHKFFYRVSRNGSNFSKTPDPHFAIGSSPTMASGFGLNNGADQLYLYSTTSNNPDTDSAGYYYYPWGAHAYGNRTTDEQLDHSLLSWTGHP